MSRPEHTAPPEIFYGDTEALKYTQNSRIQLIQSEMTRRAIDLLAIPEDESQLILDIGCGSGLSGEILDEEGHRWIGVDIAPSMLEVALDREVEGDLFLQDIGQGFGFRAGTFDSAISVSVIQWLCNADTTSHSPGGRLKRFFTTLYSSLCRGAKAVFQFYPESDDQVQFIMSFAMKAGFEGGLVVDFPNSKKAKKFYLCLRVGGGEGKKEALPEALQHEGMATSGSRTIANESRRTESKHGRSKSKRKSKDKVIDQNWILAKKELYRKRGKTDIPRDSIYTGRKRPDKF